MYRDSPHQQILGLLKPRRQQADREHLKGSHLSESPAQLEIGNPTPVTSSGSQPFEQQGLVPWKTTFPQTRGRGRFQDSSSTLCTLVLSFYQTSDHQALDPRG